MIDVDDSEGEREEADEDADDGNDELERLLARRAAATALPPSRGVTPPLSRPASSRKKLAFGSSRDGQLVQLPLDRFRAGGAGRSEGGVGGNARELSTVIDVEDSEGEREEAEEDGSEGSGGLGRLLARRAATAAATAAAPSL
ncbi:MAG: hypothetical protein VYD05_11460, partial [Planctomycetota bacterium]|nr:hypothetical protein [Planctomycetota bacterium]